MADKSQMLADWVIDSLPRHDYIMVAVAPPNINEIIPIVYIVTDKTPQRRRQIIDDNPLWLAGFFVGNVSRQDVLDAIKSRYEEIERLKN
jgi:hypothetical protein